MDRILKLIRAADIYRCGIKGQGVGVAVLDTGIYLHRDFGNRIFHFEDMVAQKKTAYDDNGHGTHIAGIIGGAGRQEWHGVAPECGLYCFKVLDGKGNGKIEDTCRAVERVMEWNRQYAGKIRIMNISVGMMEHVQPQMQRKLLAAVERAWDSGIVVLAAAGNNGPGENTVTSPGISRKIITVGSLDDGSANFSGTPGKSGYSGRGPTENCIVKPEILMPGTNIRSCSNAGNGYTRKSGTSMAVPILSGMLALLFCRYPQMNPNEVKMRLFYAASPKGLTARQMGWGTVTLDRLFA